MDKLIDRLGTYSGRLMPEMGKADTVAGEIIRALNKLVYRWYNDGDKINVEYGRETCNAPARFLGEKCPDTFDSSLWGWMSDDDYEKALLATVEKILDWLDTTDLENVPNSDDMLDWYDAEYDRDYDEDDEEEYWEDDDDDYDEDYEE